MGSICLLQHTHYKLSKVSIMTKLFNRVIIDKNRVSDVSDSIDTPEPLTDVNFIENAYIVSFF